MTDEEKIIADLRIIKNLMIKKNKLGNAQSLGRAVRLIERLMVQNTEMKSKIQAIQAGWV